MPRLCDPSPNAETAPPNLSEHGLVSRPTASLSSAATQLSLGGFVEPRLDPAPRLTPFIKWPGGKGAELRSIAGASPILNGRFIEPFVGGASVLLAVPASDSIRCTSGV